MISRSLVCVLLAVATGVSHVSHAETPEPPAGTVFIPAGSYQPLYAKGAAQRVTAPFFMDIVQVTNGKFLDFVTAHPEWRRSKASRTQADANYLHHWAGDLDLGADAERLSQAPVTNVSWFAAKAYCESQGRRLPTQDEWEFAARADATRFDASGDQVFLRQLLEWYSKPANSNLEPVQSAPLNVYGLRGMHGQVWEWVQDFNSTLIVGDSRGDGSLERKLFCGAGSLLAADVSNYAAFMRYAFRSSLKGDYCVGSLGFRAARSVGPEPLATVAATGVITSPYDLTGRWRTQDDTEISLSELRGKVRVVTMGFTSCQYACGRIMSDMQQIERDLGADAAKTGFVFFSIDPERDNPAKTQAVLLERKMDASRWTFLSAPKASVQELSVVLGFKYQQIDEFFAHSNIIAVIDSNGVIVHREEILGADLGPTVAAVRKLLAAP
ncbi:MAG: SUMF1/EgtB/PvdO family nonheme iron enzyme [Verrucomicrobiales bacterium]|nr:SUMF1/EgtB/PvdO family nonheme iron enzyme [Verrucomicrobiales bacterium]MCP5556447.1 SUMF1/EgtB/PvdO family nonheme iron enzyme [Verrucomicrobiaceae bacterium]